MNDDRQMTHTLGHADEDQEIEDALRRVYGPVDRQGVWASIEKRAVEETDRSPEIGRRERVGMRMTRKPRRARVAVYATTALVLAAGLAIGTVFGVGDGQGGYWEKLPVATEGGQIYAMAMDPSDSSTIYAVSDYGVYKSVDAAGSWTLVRGLESETLGVTAHHSILVDPSSPSTVYLASNFMGAGPDRTGVPFVQISRSDNGGDSWSDVGEIGPSNVGLQMDGEELGMSLPRSGTLYADSSTTPSTLYFIDGYSLSLFDGECLRSIDKGETWTKVEGAERQKVGETLKPSPSQVREARWVQIEDTDGNILGFSTFGSTFSALSDPTDPTVFYVGTGDGVCKSTDGGNSWVKTNRGMSRPVGGPLVLDPSSPAVLYIAASEGVFKSSDGGSTWDLILPVRYAAYEGDRFSSLVIAPSAPSTLYAWTPEGLFRTDDGGATWSDGLSEYMVRSTYSDARPGCQLLMVAGDDPNTLFAVIDDGMVRSTDGGRTWRVVISQAQLPDVIELVADPEHPSVMYATTLDRQAFYRGDVEGAERGLVKSVDKGQTWEEILVFDATQPGGLVLGGGDPAVVYTFGGGLGDGGPVPTLSRSADGGSTWETVDLSGLAGSMIWDGAVDPRSPDTIYVLRDTSALESDADQVKFRVSRSLDGGDTWEDIADADGVMEETMTGSWSMFEVQLVSHPMVVSPSDGSLYLASQAGVCRWVWTEDGQKGESSESTTVGADDTLTETTVATSIDYSRGGDWKRLVLSGGGGRVSALVMDPSDAQVIYAATEMGLYKTEDGAGSWSKILDFVGSPEVAVDPLSPNTVYVALPDMDSPWIRRSDDGGDSWVELDATVVLGNDQKSEYFFDGAGFGPTVQVDGVEASTIYMDTDSGEWKSTDRGESWTSVTRSEIERETVAWWGIGLAASPLGLWGVVIEDADDGGSANVEVAVADPSDPAIIYAGSFGGGVFKSTDGGETWHRASIGLTSNLVYGVIPDPVFGSILYALTDEGVQKSTNGGATWAAILPGQFFYSYSYELPGGSIGGESGTSLVVAPSVPSTLYALNGDGVLRSTDGGDTWETRAGEGLATTNGRPTPQMARLILVDSSDPDIVMATTFYQLLRSEDGGDTWNVISGLWGASELLVDASDPQVIYTRAAEEDANAPTRPGAIPEGWNPRPPTFLFKSLDGGASWSKTSSPEGFEHGLMGLDSHDPAWLYAVNLDSDTEPPRSSAMVSRDGGLTWEAVDLSGGGMFYELPLFDPISPDTMYLKVIDWGDGDDISLGGVYRSTDGGVTWTDIVDDTVADDISLTLAISPADGTLYGYSPFGLFKWEPKD